MTNLNTTPNPFGKHSFRDNAVDSAASQTYEFDIDGSVAASARTPPPPSRSSAAAPSSPDFAGAALACMLAFGVQGAIIDPATAEATGTPSATQIVINTDLMHCGPGRGRGRQAPAVRQDTYADAVVSSRVGYRLGRRDDRGRLPHHQQPRGRRRQRL